MIFMAQNINKLPSVPQKLAMIRLQHLGCKRNVAEIRSSLP